MENLAFFLFKLCASGVLLALAWRPIGKHMEAYRAKERSAFEDGTALDRDSSIWPRDTMTYIPLVVAMLVILTSPFTLPHPGSKVVYKYVPVPPVYLEYPASVPYQHPPLPAQRLLASVFNQKP